MKLTTLKSRLQTVGPRLSALPVATGTVERKRGAGRAPNFLFFSTVGQ
ncbi:hypothetical protein [Massilia sp. BHUDP2]